MSDASTRVISSKNVYKAKLFDVNEVTLDENGRQVIHHIVKRDPTVVIFPVTKDDKIYLIRQYRYLLGKRSLEAVAGFIDEGETPMQAAKRELKEETGISANVWEHMITLDMSASVIDAKAHLFLAKDLELGESNPEKGEEDIELVLLPIQEAVQKIQTGEIHFAATSTGLLLIKNMMR